MDEAGGFEAEKRKVCPRGSDFKWIDQFPYYPTYRYHPYRSQIGACFSLLAGFIFFVRLVSSTINWFDLPPVVTEAREQFARDPTDTYELPRIGVQFRQNGWKPFNDPRYIAITFDQGVIQKSGNVTYTSLGGKECSFIDKDGRLIADDARCASGRVAGSAPRTHSPTALTPRLLPRQVPVGVGHVGDAEGVPAGRLPRRDVRLRARAADPLQQRDRHRGEAAAGDVHDAERDRPAGVQRRALFV